MRAVTAALLFGLPGQLAAQDTIPRFTHSDCAFPPPAAYPVDLSRECGHLVVPEVRGRAGNHRTFRLAVVIYRTKNPDGSPPLLLLHGGPGGVGGTRFVWTELQFPLARQRDVITYDMRGVGGSEPQFCPQFDAEGSAAFNLRTRREWEAAYRTAVRACVEAMDAQGLDRTAYGADVNAADARDLRRALGIGEWDIYGVSYGGLVAQELLRIDSKGTRAATLVSTTAPGPAYAAQFTSSYQRNLERVFADCAAQPACARAFPTLEKDFYALYEELSAQPVEVPATGASPPRRVLLDGDRLLMELRRAFQTPTSLRGLPFLINELRRGDRDAAFRHLVGSGVIGSWGPLGRVVQCNEYGAEYRRSVAAELPSLRPAFRTIADDFREHCDLWLPKLVSRADLRPVVSDAPTLVLHGEYDPMDIPATQRRMTAKLTHAYSYTFPGETHANPPVGCHGLIVQQFLKDPRRAPDNPCLTRMRGLEFKTTRLQPVVRFVISTAGTPTPLAGTWEATLGGGPDWTFELESDGEMLRGVVPELLLTIFDGRITGTTLSFKVKSFDGARTITFSGTLQGDELSFIRTVEVVPGGNVGGPGLFGGAGPRSLKARRIQ